MPGKVVLAYSGGLDTSVAIKWLQEKYNLDVIAVTIDVGNERDFSLVRQKALDVGAIKVEVIDAKETFVNEYVFPALQANAIYEGTYSLATALSRPLMAKLLVEVALAEGASAVAHGCTGKGNDQVRFELGGYALKPGVKVIAPWREWDLTSREKLMAYCEEHNIPVDFSNKKKKSPYSMDANLLHISYEGKALEDPWVGPDEEMFTRAVSPEAAPDGAVYVETDFEAGDPVAVDGGRLAPAVLLARLNALAGAHGVGRVDIVENRFVGMKSRGVYETPGGTLLLAARRAVESLTLDKGAQHQKDELMPRYAELVYNGFWFSPEREMLQALIDRSQARVTGKVRLKLYKGNVQVVGREAPGGLYSGAHVTFEDDAVYDQRDAEGFIKLNALRLRLARRRGE